MGIYDEYLDEEAIEALRIDWGPGLCSEDWARIAEHFARDGDEESTTMLPRFRIVFRDLRWTIF